ncbi:MAG: hypothetical protein AAF802_03315 [Planctomycetota bacterium]
MAASNRAKLIAKLHTELKKKYSLPPSQPSRPLLEHILYACLLQDAPYDLADEGLAKCEQEFFDWNEVRVTTVTELTQVLSGMPDPAKSARRLKDTLQSLFEEFYSFDLDHLKKENLGKAVAKLEAMPAVTPFVLSYTVQHGLGGHSIPVDYAAMVIMLSTGIASQTEAAKGKVPGLERAIAKNRGVEFGSLLHQAGVALMMDHSDKKTRAVIDAVDKGSSARYDEWEASKKAAIRRVRRRRREEKAAEEAAEEVVESKPTKKTPAKDAAKTAAKDSAKAGKAAAAKSSAAKSPPAKAATAKPKATDVKETTSKSDKSTRAKTASTKSVKSSASKTPKKSAQPAETKKKKPASKKAAKKSTKKKAAKKSTASKTTTTKKSSNRKLSKRKPR